MNCRVCNSPTTTLLTMPDMPAMAQYLSDTPEEHKTTLNLCQCTGCGLVQLANAPVWYWDEEVRTENAAMRARIRQLPEVDFYSLNRLEHMPDPNKYLNELDGQTGIIEVPNFDMIIVKRLFAEITLDHLLYFTADTLRFTLMRNGFEVRSITSVWDDYILSAEVVRRNPLKLYGFQEQTVRLATALEHYISRYDRVAIYGASHQAFAYIAMLQPEIAFIVDDASFKQGKYSPVGGLMIHHPIALYNPYGLYDFGQNNPYGKPPDAVIIMGAGYSDEIAKTLDFDGGIAIMRDWGVEVIK